MCWFKICLSLEGYLPKSILQTNKKHAKIKTVLPLHRMATCALILIMLSLLQICWGHVGLAAPSNCLWKRASRSTTKTSHPPGYLSLRVPKISWPGFGDMWLIYYIQYFLSCNKIITFNYWRITRITSTKGMILLMNAAYTSINRSKCIEAGNTLIFESFLFSLGVEENMQEVVGHITEGVCRPLKVSSRLCFKDLFKSELLSAGDCMLCLLSCFAHEPSCSGIDLLFRCG